MSSNYSSNRKVWSGNLARSTELTPPLWDAALLRSRVFLRFAHPHAVSRSCLPKPANGSFRSSEKKQRISTTPGRSPRMRACRLCSISISARNCQECPNPTVASSGPSCPRLHAGVAPGARSQIPRGCPRPCMNQSRALLRNIIDRGANPTTVRYSRPVRRPGGSW